MNFIKLIITIGILFSQLNLVAQRGERFERIEAKKVAFITDELDLSVKESQQFWPLYNEHQDKLKGLRSKYQFDEDIDWESLNDSDAAVLIDNKLSFEEEDLQLKKKYIKDLKSVLPTSKIAKLMHLEAEFKKRLLKMLNRRRRMK